MIEKKYKYLNSFCLDCKEAIPSYYQISNKTMYFGCRLIVKDDGNKFNGTPFNCPYILEVVVEE